MCRIRQSAYTACYLIDILIFNYIFYNTLGNYNNKLHWQNKKKKHTFLSMI